MSRRIEIGLERVDRDLERRVGVGAPQLAPVEHHGVEPLRIVARSIASVSGEDVAAVHALDRADLAARVARQAGVRSPDGCSWSAPGRRP